MHSVFQLDLKCNLVVYGCREKLAITFSRFAFGRYWNRCLPKCLFKDTMLLCNCKEKIKKLSTAFAIALLSARLEQTVCYKL